ncbi:MAG: pyridoxal phosphate-dependent aminotransferase, partial [Candidatus Woesearchaeota archaeon]
PQSPIRKFIPYALAAKTKGNTVYHLNIGQPDVPTPKIFFDTIKAYHEPVLAYEHSAGYAPLIQAIREYYQQWGIELQQEDIIITAGGSEALMMAFGILTNPGDEVLVFEPYYANYNTFALAHEVTLKAITTRLEENFAITDIKKIIEQITPKTKAILINSPGNPSGTILSKEELDIVATVAETYGLYVISDEVYREFAYDGKVAKSMLEYPQIKEQVIVIDSISKRYSACGARIGWIASKNKDITLAALKYAQARLSVVSLEQIGAAAMIANASHEIENAKQAYDQRRKLAYEILTKENIPCGYPSGALYMIADLGVDAEAFIMYMLTEYSGLATEHETVLVTPAQAFYQTPRIGTTQVRIAFVLENQALAKALHHLIRGLKEFKEKGQRAKQERKKESENGQGQ